MTSIDNDGVQLAEYLALERRLAVLERLVELQERRVAAAEAELARLRARDDRGDAAKENPRRLRIGDRVRARGNYRDEDQGERAPTGVHVVRATRDTSFLEWTSGQLVKTDCEDDWVDSAWFALLDRPGTAVALAAEPERTPDANDAS